MDYRAVFSTKSSDQANKRSFFDFGNLEEPLLSNYSDEKKMLDLRSLKGSIDQEASTCADNISPPQGLQKKRSFTNLRIETDFIDEAAEEEECTEYSQQSDKSWIFHSLLAAVLIAVCNTTITDLSALGVEGLMYLFPGNILCGLMYWTLKPLLTPKTHDDGYQSMEENQGKVNLLLAKGFRASRRS